MVKANESDLADIRRERTEKALKKLAAAHLDLGNALGYLVSNTDSIGLHGATEALYTAGRRIVQAGDDAKLAWLAALDVEAASDTRLGISQPKEAAATSGAQAAPHPCSLRPKTKGAIDAYEAAANGAAKKIGTILDTTVPVVSLGQGDSSKNIYAEDLIDPSRQPSTANGEVR